MLHRIRHPRHGDRSLVKAGPITARRYTITLVEHPVVTVEVEFAVRRLGYGNHIYPQERRRKATSCDKLQQGSPERGGSPCPFPRASSRTKFSCWHINMVSVSQKFEVSYDSLQLLGRDHGSYGNKPPMIFFVAQFHVVSPAVVPASSPIPCKWMVWPSR